MKSTFNFVLNIVLVSALLIMITPAQAEDFVVYSIYKQLDMGNPGEVPQKDYYINLGHTQGVHEGTTVTVYRKVSTYDLLSEKLYKDMTFPIAKLKVIHSEGSASIARMEKMLAGEFTPAITPKAVMIGDIIVR